MAEFQRAFSIQQPWADAIMDGRLDHMRRPRRTKQLGRFYLYATREVAEDARFPVGAGQVLVTGAVLGTVDIIDCVETADGFHWMLANPERFEVPRRPVNGAQPGFWTPKFEEDSSAG